MKCLRGGLEFEQFKRFRPRASFTAATDSVVQIFQRRLHLQHPEFFGRDIDVFFTASGLRREEVSFIREEYGGGAGVRNISSQPPAT